MLKRIMSKITMTDKGRELLFKTSVVLTGICAAWVFISPFTIIPLIYPLINGKEGDLITMIMLFPFLISGSIMTFLLFTLDFVKIKPVKGERYPSLFASFEETVEYFDKATNGIGYVKQEMIEEAEDVKMQIYANDRMGSGYFVILNRISQMEDDTLDVLDEIFDKFITEYYGSKSPLAVHLTIVMCVDRVTPQFYKFVDNNIHNDLKLFQLPAGISYGGKQIYIAKQKDGYAVLKYKKMRKEFLELLDIDPKPTKKEKDVLN